MKQPWAPYHPPAYTQQDVLAIQALATGTASAEQQQHALRYVIESVSRYYEVSYCPGPDGARESAMAEGRRFVGGWLVLMTKMNVSVLFKEK